MEDDGAAQGMAELFAKGMEVKLSESLVDHGGGMVTGFIGLVSYIDGNGDQFWSFITNEGQPIVTSLGMIDIAQMLVGAQAANVFGDPP